MNFKNIAEMFLDVTKQCASKEFLIYKKNNQWIGLNGQDVRITVEDIAFGLRSLGIQNKSNIAIISNNSPRWAMCDYGIICSAMTTVTIYPTLIDSQVEFILKDSNSELIFVENLEQLNKIERVSSSCENLKYIVVMDDSYNEKSDRIFNISTLFDKGKAFAQTHDLSFSNMIESINEEDILTLIYTSGTTGIPKGVVLTHKNLLSNVEATLKVADFDVQKEKFLSFLPLSHVLERMGGHYTALSIGASIFYAENIEKVADNLVETSPTVVVCVPRLFEKMYTKIIEGLKTAPKIKRKLFYWALSVGKKYSETTLNKEKIGFSLSFKHKVANKLIYSKVKQKLGGNIKFFVSGGAPLSKEIAEFFASVDIMILEGYGLTETSPVLSVNSPPLDIRFGTVGKPLFNVDIKIAGDGEILAKGPNIMKGYYNNEAATKEVFDDDGWFKTGDIGVIDEDGFLKITDRKKSLLVTSGGKNIAPAPIEGALANSSYIDQVLVIGDKRNFISALIVPNFDAVKGYLKTTNNHLTELEAIINHEEVIKLYDSEITSIMENFSNYEKVKKFSLLKEPFSIDKGEMTPKMSIVRKVVEKNYTNLINNMYEQI